MKTTALEKIEIPSEAQLQLPATRSAVNTTRSSYDMESGTAAKWITGNWIGAGVTVGSSFSPFIVDHMVGLPITTGIITMLSILASMLSIGVLSSDTVVDMKKKLKELNKDVTPNNWNNSSDYRGFRISSRYRKSGIFNLFLPRRIFRPVLMNETVWYSATKDLYTIEKHYLTAGNWVEETQEVGGRRYAFKQALNSF